MIRPSRRDPGIYTRPNILMLMKRNSVINLGNVLYNDWHRINSTLDLRHDKTDLKVFVAVIPEEGWTHVAAPMGAIWCMTLSYQKKDGRGHARPSFFWYNNYKDLKVCFLMTHHTLVIFKTLQKSQITF